MLDGIHMHICWEREEHRGSKQEYGETEWCLAMEISVSERESKKSARKGRKQEISVTVRTEQWKTERDQH